MMDNVYNILHTSMTSLNPLYNNPDTRKAALLNEIIFIQFPSNKESLVTAACLYGESIASDSQQEFVQNKMDDMGTPNFLASVHATIFAGDKEKVF